VRVVPKGSRLNRPTALLAAACLFACAHGQSHDAEPYTLTLQALEPVRVPLPPNGLRGRLVVVQFFATYCFPCLAMLPRLSVLQERYAEQGLVAVGVGMDLEGPTVLAPFADHYRFPFAILAATDAVRNGSSAFGPIAELPATVLLDRQGRPMAAFPGVVSGEQLDQLVLKALRAEP
jgi:thiol-disulfide isomerase/thioredoxin